VWDRVRKEEGKKRTLLLCVSFLSSCIFALILISRGYGVIKRLRERERKREKREGERKKRENERIAESVCLSEDIVS
jgi:cell division protein FtsB